MIEAELVKYGPTGVAIAVIILGGVVTKHMFAYLSKLDKNHCDAMKKMSDSFEKNAKAVDQNTKVTDETYKFLKNLNGSLRKAVEEHKN